MKLPGREELSRWSRHYSDSDFQQTLRRRTAALGRRPIELGLTLFYTLRSPGTPTWCKAVISGSLGYFISLIDAVPDLTPVLGYTDDVSVMLAALAMLGVHVTPDIRRQARATTQRLFGDGDNAPSQAYPANTADNPR
ncbi:YkvA family protein [Marinobacter bohaiensis]|uniref:YkvA family protein n=1 Tax=Marinobacter bohaiensis TaxID=2201898 RepID=UPI000DABC100|nr:YkvA family protein [Marinobacter bohaiensis]